MCDEAKVIVVMIGIAAIGGCIGWAVCDAVQRINRARRSRKASKRFQREWKERTRKWPTAAPRIVAWDSLLDVIPKGTGDEIFDALMTYTSRIGDEVPKRTWPGLLCSAIEQSRNRKARGTT